MKLKTKLLLLAAFFVLAVPLVLSGVAAANGGFPGGFNPPAGSSYYIGTDGATPNSYGGFTYGTQTTNPPTTQSACVSSTGTLEPSYTTQATCTAAGAPNYYTWYQNGFSTDACLQCHSSVNDREVQYPQQTYLLMGHRNMLRMVTNSPVDNGTTVLLGDVFFTANNSLGAGCTLPQYTTSGTCTPAGGSWITPMPSGPPTYATGAYWPYTNGPGNEGLDYNAQTNPLPIVPTDYYVYGGWWETIAASQIARGTYGSAAYPPAQPRLVAPGGSAYTCGQCHTTGYDMPGATNPSNGAQTLYTTANAETWYYEGIQCERCHMGVLDPISQPDQANLNPTSVLYSNSGMGWNSGSYNWKQSGDIITGLCHQCHLQESTSVNAGDNSTGDTDTYIKPYLLAVTGSVDPGAPSSATPPTNNAASTFSSHYRSNQFLNSPHARFSGTTGGVAEWNQYNTNFAVSASACSNSSYLLVATCTSNGGTWSVQSRPAGCSRCHNVHRSAVDPNVMNMSTGALDGYSNINGPVEIQSGAGARCGTNCHGTSTIMDSVSNVGTTWNGEPAIATFNHPQAAGTPFDQYVANGGATGGSTKSLQFACVTCHMGPGTNHLFRIEIGSTTAPYTVNVGTGGVQAAAQFNESGANGQTYPYAIGMDVGLVCGQCHDTINAPSKVTAYKSNILSFSYTQMASAALGMHSGGSTATADCLACHAAGNTVGAPVITPGTNHHGVHVTCYTCHGDSAHTGALAATTGESGTLPLVSYAAGTAGNAFCQQCHTNSVVAGQHGTHHVTNEVATAGLICTNCHSVYPDTVGAGTEGYAGVAPVWANLKQTDCMNCHSMALGSATNPDFIGTPTTIEAINTAGATPNHHGSFANCIACHQAEPMNPVAVSTGFNDATAGPGTLPAVNYAAGTAGNAFCLGCHTNSGPYADHHAVSTLASQSSNNTCTVCHSVVATIGTFSYAGEDVPAPWPTAADCQICHSTITSLHYNMGTLGSTINCVDCHGKKNATTGQGTSSEPIVTPTVGNLGTQTCLYCHNGTTAQGLTQTQVNADIPNMHNNAPIAGFTYTLGNPNTLVLNVSAVPPSSCPSGNCSFGWAWGDSTTTPASTASTASHTYGTAGTYTVTLTVTDNVSLATAIANQSITVYTYTAAPVASGTLTPGTNGWSATVQDTSTGAPTSVTVIWGDELSSTGTPGSSFSHTYLNAGTYTVKLKAVNTGGSNTATLGTVSIGLTITGAVYQSNGTTPVAGAAAIIQTITSPVKTYVGITNGSGVYTVSNLKPGTYNITIAAAGYVFPTGPQITNVTVGPPLSVTVPNVLSISP